MSLPVHAWIETLPYAEEVHGNSFQVKTRRSLGVRSDRCLACCIPNITLSVLWPTFGGRRPARLMRCMGAEGAPSLVVMPH